MVGKRKVSKKYRLAWRVFTTALLFVFPVIFESMGSNNVYVFVCAMWMVISVLGDVYFRTPNMKSGIFEMRDGVLRLQDGVLSSNNAENDPQATRSTTSGTVEGEEAAVDLSYVTGVREADRQSNVKYEAL